MKPSTTLTVFIHEPDFGALCNHDGNIANRQNGMASAKENPNIPTAGPKLSPVLAASTSRVPMIGPVHENDTSVSVNAMKNMLNKPVVRSAVESILLLHDEGSWILNAPKNDTANTTSNRKKMMLHTALVDNALRALAPNRAEIIRPRARYITMIDTP